MNGNFSIDQLAEATGDVILVGVFQQYLHIADLESV